MPNLCEAMEESAMEVETPGVAGSITLDEKRNPTKPAVVLEVAGGKLKYVATIAP